MPLAQLRSDKTLDPRAGATSSQLVPLPQAVGRETPGDCRGQDGRLRKKRLEKVSKRKLGQGVGEGSLGNRYPRVDSSGLWVSQFRGSGILGKTDLRLWPGPRNRPERDPRIPFLLSSLWARPNPAKAEFRASLEAGLGGQNSLLITERSLGYPSAVQRHFQEKSAEKASSVETAREEERRAKGEGERGRPGLEKASPTASWAQAPRGGGNQESEAQAGKHRASRPLDLEPLLRAAGAVCAAGSGKRGWAAGGSSPARR